MKPVEGAERICAAWEEARGPFPRDVPREVWTSFALRVIEECVAAALNDAAARGRSS